MGPVVCGRMTLQIRPILVGFSVVVARGDLVVLRLVVWQVCLSWAGFENSLDFGVSGREGKVVMLARSRINSVAPAGR